MKKPYMKSLYSNKLFIASCLLVVPVVLLLSFHFYSRIGAFGCFDDCTVFAAGHFLLLGRVMYSEIFFNHQMLMPYLSAIIQWTTNPNSLYQLVLYHRLFIIIFSWLAMITIVWRFRWSGLLFILIYEPLKFYFFGDRFLPESMIVYMIAFLLGLMWIRIGEGSLKRYDYYIAALLSSIIVLLREPYVPVALVIFALITVSYPLKKSHIKSIILFIVIVSVVYLFHPLRDYIDTVFLVNAQGVASAELQSNNIMGKGLLQVFLYPLYILFTGHSTFLRYFLVAYSLIFILLSIVVSFILKQPKRVLLLWFLLGLIGIRTVSPGYQYYEAFHLVPWMGMFAMSIGLLTVHIARFSQYLKVMIVVSAFIVVLSLVAVFHPNSFIYTSQSAQDEFEIGYSNYQEYANYINVLKEDGDVLFVDEWDDIMYWATDLDSSYEYGLYTPWNQSIERYEDAKQAMMFNSPPDIYYCSEGFEYEDNEILATKVGMPYTRVYKNAKSLCLFVHNDKLNEYSAEKIEQLNEAGITFEKQE